MEVKILYNYDDELFCTECKCKIQYGEKFAIVYEDNEEKIYHTSCLPETELE